MNELLETLNKFQRRYTGHYSVAHGGFKFPPHELVFAAGGGNGGGFVYEEYTNKRGDLIKVGPYAGEEADFFSDCKNLNEAIERAIKFCSTKDFEDSCYMAEFGDAMGKLLAEKMVS